MAALPVPTIPVRMNDFSITLSVASFLGVTMDGLHMCWTTGNNDIVIQRIAYDNDAGTIVLKGGAQDYLGISISSFQSPVNRSNIFVSGNRIWTMKRGTGQVYEWDRNGNIVKYYRGETSNFTQFILDPQANPSPVEQTFFSEFQMLRRDPVDNRTVIRSYVYDNSSWCASVILNRRNYRIMAQTIDKSLDNFTNIRSNFSVYSSNNSYGLFFNGSNTLNLNYVGGINRIYGFLRSSSTPVAIRNNDKVHDIYYPNSNEQTGYIGSNLFTGSYAALSPQVQAYSSSSGATFSLVNFNNKYFRLVNNSGANYCVTRGIPVNLLIPRAFIDPFSNSIITPNLGTFTMRMYTDGNTFGTIASVDGLQFLFLAAFPANKSVPINNYSLGIGAKKP